MLDGTLKTLYHFIDGHPLNDRKLSFPKLIKWVFFLVLFQFAGFRYFEFDNFAEKKLIIVFSLRIFIDY